MQNNIEAGATVLVVGAGIMGAGIAQVAAQAGYVVRLFDSRAGAAAQAISKLGTTLQGLAHKGKLKPAAVTEAMARISAIDSLDEAGDVALVIEAIIENLEIKRSLFKQLEACVSDDCIVATNTSSISVTALANGMRLPQRLVGMHFFNPVPLMKLVEVVSGLRTDPAVAQAIFALSQAWGKVPVHARSTPGFIVNRIARPYYAETLALLHERAGQPQVLDACLRAVGFRLGPCELIDLIGQDTNFAVTQSVFEANSFDKRYVPSLLQREMVDGGLLGRKSGQGFYRYPAGLPPLEPPALQSLEPVQSVVVHGRGALAELWHQRLSLALGRAVARQPDSEWQGISADDSHLRLSDGRSATEVAVETGLSDVAVFDWHVLPGGSEAAAGASGAAAAAGAAAAEGAGRAGDAKEAARVDTATPSFVLPLAYALAAQSSKQWHSQAAAWLTALGFMPLRLADAPGLVVTRTLAMLINEAADAVQQGVCTEAGADDAVKLGLNYPAGPFEWLAQWGAPQVVTVLEALDAHYRGERYRVSPWLRQRAAHRASALQPRNRN